MYLPLPGEWHAGQNDRLPNCRRFAKQCGRMNERSLMEGASEGTLKPRWTGLQMSLMLCTPNAVEHVLRPTCVCLRYPRRPAKSSSHDQTLLLIELTSEAC